MISGYLAAFGFVFLLLVGVYCFGYAAKRSSLLHVLLLETVLGTLVVFPLLFFTPNFHVQQLFSSVPATNLIWLGAAAVFGFAGGNYFTLLHLKTAGEKMNSLLSPAVTAFTLFLSYLVFHETLSGWQWAGMVITLLAVYGFLIKHGKKEKRSGNSLAAIGSGIATVICISAAIISSIKGASGSGIHNLHAIWLRLFFALLLVGTAYLLTGEYKKWKKQSVRFYAAVIAGVVTQTIVANYLWLHASFQLGISVFQIIIATFPLWMYAVDVYLLRRSRASWYFIATALLAGAGVCLVVL